MDKEFFFSSSQDAFTKPIETIDDLLFKQSYFTRNGKTNRNDEKIEEEEEEEEEDHHISADNPSSESKIKEVKIEPKYSWILKDLNFDRYRIIDVTDQLAENSEKLKIEEDDVTKLDTNPNDSTVDSADQNDNRLLEEQLTNILHLKNNESTDSSHNNDDDNGKIIENNNSNDSEYESDDEYETAESRKYIKILQKRYNNILKRNHNDFDPSNDASLISEVDENSDIELQKTSEIKLDDTSASNIMNPSGLTIIDTSDTKDNRSKLENRSKPPFILAFDIDQNFENTADELIEPIEKNKPIDLNSKNIFIPRTTTKKVSIICDDSDSNDSSAPSATSSRKNSIASDRKKLSNDNITTTLNHNQEPKYCEETPLKITQEPLKQPEKESENEQNSKLKSTENTSIQFEEMHKRILDSLKTEWSVLISKLEQDYKVQLNEQQRNHEEKLKKLYDEITECVKGKQQLVKEDLITDTINSTDTKLSESIEQISQENIVDVNNEQTKKRDLINNINADLVGTSDPKYISNLRLTLKTKHSKHIQDLKAYYEQEIEDLKKELQKAQNQTSRSFSPNEKVTQTPPRSPYESTNGTEELGCLKSQNFILNKKLKDVQLRYDYSTSEINKLKADANIKDDKIKRLENYVTQLEKQLDDFKRTNDSNLKELQSIKRNYSKKCQDYDDLVEKFKPYQEDINELELQSLEKDAIIASLKTNLNKIEADLARTDYEYQKLRSRYTSNNSSFLLTQTMQSESQTSQVHPYPINRQNAFSSPSRNETLLQSPRRQINIKIHKSPSSNLSKDSGLAKHNEKNNTEFSPIAITTGNCDESVNDKKLLMHPTSSNLEKAYQNYTNDISNSRMENSISSASFISNIFDLSPEKRIDYINKLENDFDRLMKRKQYLEAQLTRLPTKTSNTNMHIIRHTLENETIANDHKLASVKLELRKLHIIKTTH